MTDTALTHEARIRALEAALLYQPPSSPAADVTLKEQIDTRITALEKATEIAANAMERRLEGMNEFRDQLKDQASRFVTRDEMDIQVGVNREAISDLRTFKDRLEGKASAQSVYIAYAFALVSLVLSVIGLLVK